MFRKKQLPQKDYDRENWKPILKCSICNGERVAGFKNIRTGEFREELFIQEEAQLEEFRRRYKITELPKEY
nr:aspartate dehydrogenase [uncultured Acetatifactor sp.]